MQTFFRIALITVLSCLLLPVQGLTQESAGTVDVVATGYGKDVPSATSNALRAAVEQVVGSMVYAESLIDEGEVVSDKILSSSVGYIESSRTLGEPRITDDGFVSVRIFATVKRRELGEELLKTGVNRVFFDGRAHQDLAIQRRKTLDDTFDMIEQMVDDLHFGAMSTSLIEKDYDSIRNRAVFEIETKVNADKYVTFINGLVELLPNVNGKTVVTSQQVTLDKPEGNNRGALLIVPKAVSDQISHNVPRLLIFNSWQNDMRVGRMYNATLNIYTMPPEEWKVILQSFRRKFLVVEALGSNDEVLASAKVRAPLPYFLFQHEYGFIRPGSNSSYTNQIALFPTLHVAPENGGLYTNSEVFPGTPTYKQMVYMDFPIQELDKVTTVRFSYE